MSKIDMGDTTIDVLIKMSDGNPGAIAALMTLLTTYEDIDPQAFMGGLGAIMLLDKWEIYGSAIHILFKDKCKQNVRKMVVIMRATQLGLFSHIKLKEMAYDSMYKINVTDEEWRQLDIKVCEQLKDFKRVA